MALQQYMHMIQIQITPNGGATLRLVGHEPPNIYIYIYKYLIYTLILLFICFPLQILCIRTIKIVGLSHVLPSSQ